MKKPIFISTLIVLAIAGAFLAYGGYKAAFEMENIFSLESRAAAEARKAALARRKSAWEKLKKDFGKEVSAFNGTAGIVIKDLDMNWEASLNKDLLVPSASVVKIPIMMSYFMAEAEGKVRLDSKLKLTRSDKTPGSGKLKFAPAGQEYSIESLIEMMVTESDNTATNMLIDHMGFGALNGYFARLGLKGTNLSRSMMDFSERKEGVDNFTTAGDISHLMEKLYRGSFINKEASRKCMNILAGQKMRDRIPKALPEGTVVAHKTGLEKGVCHDAGIVYTDKGDYLICVLVKHRQKTAHAAKKLICTLSALAYDYLTGPK